MIEEPGPPVQARVLLLASTDPATPEQLRHWPGSAVISVDTPTLMQETVRARRRAHTTPRLHDPARRLPRSCRRFTADPLNLLGRGEEQPWAEAWKLALWMANGLPGWGPAREERVSRCAHLVAPLLLVAHETGGTLETMRDWLSEMRDEHRAHGAHHLLERNLETHFTATLSLLATAGDAPSQAAAAAAFVLRCPEAEPDFVLHDARAVLAPFAATDGDLLGGRRDHEAPITFYVAPSATLPWGSDSLLLLLSEQLIEESHQPGAPPVALALKPYLISRLSMGLGTKPPYLACSGWS